MRLTVCKGFSVSPAGTKVGTLAEGKQSMAWWQAAESNGVGPGSPWPASPCPSDPCSHLASPPNITFSYKLTSGLTHCEHHTSPKHEVLGDIQL